MFNNLNLKKMKATKENWCVKCTEENSKRLAKLLDSIKDNCYGCTTYNAYYGVFNGLLTCNFKASIRDTPIITIEEAEELYAEKELTFPREMMVWDVCEDGAEKRMVLGKFGSMYVGISHGYKGQLEDGSFFYVLQWSHAKEIEPEPTKEQQLVEELKKLKEKFGKDWDETWNGIFKAFETK